MVAANETSAVFNLSTINIQEHKLFNPHLYNVTQDQWNVYGLTMSTFVFLSITLNTLVFFVLLKDKIKSSLHLLLHCLSCYDIGVALMSFWIFCWPTICQHFK